MRGDTVIVRAFRDRAHILRVWGVTQEAVYVCADMLYLRRLSGIQVLDPVGHRRSDVFVYDEALYQRLRSGEAHWEDLIRYGAPPGDAYLVDGTVLRCLYCGARGQIAVDVHEVQCRCGQAHRLSEEEINRLDGSHPDPVSE